MEMECKSLRQYLVENNKAKEAKGLTREPIFCIENAFLEKMDLMKAFVEEIYYPKIERLYPWFTDHGKKHVESILNMVAEMLGPYRRHLNAFEIYILYMAVIFHDTGMVKSRKKHGDEVKDILSTFSSYIGNREIENIITRIAAAHTGGFEKVDRLSTKHGISYRSLNEFIDARALASLLRFADEVSETVDRIDQDLLDEDKVPEESRIYWEYANCIKISKANPIANKIEMDLRVANTIFYKEFILVKDGSEEKVPFIEYLLSRLDKMDNERRNCCANFRSMASIDTIEINLTIVDDAGNEIRGISPLLISLNEKYCDRNSFIDSFYDKNPELKDPEEFKKKLFAEVVE